MVIYHLNNAQKVVLQAKRGYEGKILAEQDYPISELKTVDLNQLSIDKLTLLKDIAMKVIKGNCLCFNKFCRGD